MLNGAEPAADRLHPIHFIHFRSVYSPTLSYSQWSPYTSILQTSTLPTSALISCRSCHSFFHYLVDGQSYCPENCAQHTKCGSFSNIPEKHLLVSTCIHTHNTDMQHCTFVAHLHAHTHEHARMYTYIHISFHICNYISLPHLWHLFLNLIATNHSYLILPHTSTPLCFLTVILPAGLPILLQVTQMQDKPQLATPASARSRLCALCVTMG